MIKIEIQKSFGEAFLYFLRALRCKKLNFILEDFPIPQFLLKNSYLIPTSKKEMIESWQTPLLFIVAFGLFSYYWLVFYKNILRVLKSLRSEKELLSNISLKIPQYTHCEWNYEKISIYPVVGKWAAARFDKVYIGITPVSLSDHESRGIIIHELIHMNTHEQSKNRMGNQLVNLDLADELAAIITTRIIQKNVLDRPAHDLQALTNPLGNIISEEELTSLEKVAARGISFANLLIYCDRTLSNKVL